jgi:NAD(P)-dependent dehydrogenase (short-subunit alcohol dehydrogenase family)
MFAGSIGTVEIVNVADSVRTSAAAPLGRLSGKAAIVTGAARGIGRATAFSFAREGANIMGIDIAGPVSSTLDVVPATQDQLTETGRLFEAAGVLQMGHHRFDEVGGAGAGRV